MPQSPVWVVIVAAAVGSLMAAILTVIGQAFERRSRQRELFLSKSVEMVQERVRTLHAIAEKDGREVRLLPEVMMIHSNFRALSRIFDGDPPNDDAKDLLELEAVVLSNEKNLRRAKRIFEEEFAKDGDADKASERAESVIDEEGRKRLEARKPKPVDEEDG